MAAPAEAELELTIEDGDNEPLESAASGGRPRGAAVDLFRSAGRPVDGAVLAIGRWRSLDTISKRCAARSISRRCPRRDGVTAGTSRPSAPGRRRVRPRAERRSRARPRGIPSPSGHPARSWRRTAIGLARASARRPRARAQPRAGVTVRRRARARRRQPADSLSARAPQRAALGRSSRSRRPRTPGRRS